MGANVFQRGDTCGGCEVVGLLGSGGFAQVYEVLDPTGARRALKVLDTDAEARPKLRARLAQEGAALAMIEHLNVVRLYDAGFHEDRIYLVLELIRGKNLREAMRAEGGRPPPETLVRWLRQAADGVGEGHRSNIVHRDLKPENILVAQQDLVKVIDFGIAKFSSWGVKTTHEQRVGTALYMSPEHIQGRPPDARMDVYALGLVLYEALAGEHPIVAGPATVFEICARQLNYRPPPLATAAPEVPPELGAAVDRAIEKDPERRLPSMRALSDALQDGLRQLTGARSAAVSRILAGPSPEAATPVIDTPLGTSAPRFATTQPMAPEVARPRAHLMRTQPMSAAEASAFAVTAPVDASAGTTETTTDAITVPVRVAAPVSRDPADAPAGAQGRSSAGVIGAVIAATALGVGGGVWSMTRLLEGASAPAAVESAATMVPAATATAATATAATIESSAPASREPAPVAKASAAPTTAPAPPATARGAPAAPRAPKPARPTTTAAPKPRAFPDDDSPF